MTRILLQLDHRLTVAVWRVAHRGRLAEVVTGGEEPTAEQVKRALALQAGLDLTALEPLPVDRLADPE